jgi:hypothetical protein
MCGVHAPGSLPRNAGKVWKRLCELSGLGLFSGNVAVMVMMRAVRVSRMLEALSACALV